ncbi:MAG: FAD-binding protein [Desulfatitalea sp.]|nr:FAD-binding protein [Desulfatitalea sp.]NNK02006.1 FAD-binding protein [Desulfatitalea sp.]
MSLSKEVIQALAEITGKDGMRVDPVDMSVYAYDATTRWRGMPEAVVFPTQVDQISAIMALANAHIIPVTVRGAGTSLSGGPVPTAGGIVMCMTRMNRILNIDTDNFTVTAEVGVVLNDLNMALAKHNLFFPPDPQSFLAATLGGCLSEGAGGPYAVKYGLFKHYILGMTVVLASGDILKLGGNTMKNVTGYDLPQLLCGAEGTLAVIADATFRLLVAPQAKQTVMAIFDDVTQAGKAVHRVRSAGVLPAKIEMIDNWVIRRIEEHTPLGLPLSAAAILLFQMDGMAPAVEKETDQVIELCRKTGAAEVRPAKDATEAQNFWTARSFGFSAVFGSAPTLISEDVVVPTSRIADLIQCIKALERTHDLTIVLLGHAGDGNLHPCILTDMDDADHYERAQMASNAIFDAALAFGGAISGEHGIGLEKQQILKKAMPAQGIDLLKQIKRAFDPKGILNPGKIWEAS